MQSLHLNTGLRQAWSFGLCWTWSFDSEKYKKVEEIRGLVCPCSKSEMYFVLNQLLKPLQCQITCVVVKHGFNDVVQNHFGNGLTVCRCLKELIGRLRNGQLLFKVRYPSPSAPTSTAVGSWATRSSEKFKIKYYIRAIAMVRFEICHCVIACVT